MVAYLPVRCELTVPHCGMLCVLKSYGFPNGAHPPYAEDYAGGVKLSALGSLAPLYTCATLCGEVHRAHDAWNEYKT